MWPQAGCRLLEFLGVTGEPVGSAHSWVPLGVTDWQPDMGVSSPRGSLKFETLALTLLGLVGLTQGRGRRALPGLERPRAGTPPTPFLWRRGSRVVRVWSWELWPLIPSYVDSAYGTFWSLPSRRPLPPGDQSCSERRPCGHCGPPEASM